MVEGVPKLKVGDWIVVNDYGFRLQEFTEKHDSEASVKFVNVEESNRIDEQKTKASEAL